MSDRLRSAVQIALNAEAKMQTCRVTRGAWGELIACSWLLENGHSVFKNVSPARAIDLIAWKDGGVLLIDVKIVNYNADTNSLKEARLSDRQHHLGVVPLYVTHDGVCSFRIEDIRALYKRFDAHPKSV